MGSQTKYYGKLQTDSVGGGRLKIICGTVKFVSSASVVSVQVPFKQGIAYIGLSNRTHPAKKGKLAYSTGTIASRAIHVSRATGSSSGMSYWYEIWGW